MQRTLSQSLELASSFVGSHSLELAHTRLHLLELARTLSFAFISFHSSWNSLEVELARTLSFENPVAYIY